jgi:hypothetical protein
VGRGTVLILRPRWAAALVLAACAHQADGPDLARLRSDPQAFQRAKRVASERCNPGPPPDACCEALMEQGDVLWATGDKARAGQAYDHARNRCPRYAPVRRHAFLMKQPASSPQAGAPAAVDVRLQAGMDVRLPTLRLAWYEAYLDGQTAIDRLVHTTVGTHEVSVELYLQPLVKGEEPVRLDITQPVTVPAELAGRTVAGGIDLSLRERAAGTITERVTIETVPRAFAAEEKFLEELRAGRLLSNGPVPAGGQPDPRASHKLLTPDLGHQQLLTPIRQLLPADLKRQSFVGLFKVCVTEAGEVQSVAVLQPPGPEREADLIAAIRGWKYRPYKIDGAPVSFCYPVRLAGERD